MYYNSDLRRVLLWIAACLFFAIFITSIWYWFYVHYYQQESLSNLLPQTNEHDNQHTESGAAQQQGHLGLAVPSGYESYELGTVHKDPRSKAGGEVDATVPVAVPTRSAARNDWGSHHAHQAPTNIKPSLSKEQGLDKSQHIARDQDSIEMAAYGRRHYPVKGSDSSGTPQMTPETGPSAAQTPDGQRTPLPRYTLGPCGADPPAYAESEPSGLAV